MAKKDKTRDKKKTTSYKVRNWSEYNQALVNRGSLTIWVSEEVMESWLDQRPAQRGSQFIYSDKAIELLLTLRHLFHLPLRATEGFGKSLFEMLKLEMPIPNYTTLCRRAKKLEVTLPKRSKKSTDLVIDSTGLKVYGEGEWKVRTHGYSKRRTWRKLHLAIDPDTHEIVAGQLTENNVSDGQAGKELIEAIDEEIDQLSADGGYDKRKFYQACIDKQAKDVVIPPQRNAKIWQHGNSKKDPHPRDENLRYIREHGRKKWKEDRGYHQRSLSETGMFRFKITFGANLQSRQMATQITEALVKCKILNTFARLGLPDSHAVKLA